MEKANQIPLEERLQKAGRDSSGSSAIFLLPLDAYLYEWDKLLGGSRFSEMYGQEIQGYACLVGGGCSLSEAVAFSDELPPTERLELLAGILVEPFAAWLEKNREEKNRKENPK